MKQSMKLKLLLSAAMVSLIGLAACSSQENKGEKEGHYQVGVLQVVEHGSLDASYQGFIEGLEENGFKEGDNLTVTYQNAQGAQDQLNTMSQKLVKERPNLLLGIATPAAQALLSASSDIPIVVTAVTDLEEAKLVKSNESPGGNLTGVSDQVPIEKQLDLLISVAKKTEKIGIMYNGGEANSVLQAKQAKAYLEKQGIAVKELTANTTNDVQQVTESLAKDVDGIYIPTDNTFASAMTLVGDVAKEKQIPVVAGSIEMVQDGGLATFGIDYHALGKQTGDMAAKILKGERQTTDYPVETSHDLKLEVNEDMAKALGIDPETIKEPK